MSSKFITVTLYDNIMNNEIPYILGTIRNIKGVESVSVGPNLLSRNNIKNDRINNTSSFEYKLNSSKGRDRLMSQTNKEKCILDIVDHKLKVGQLLSIIIGDLSTRAINHDNSKLTSTYESDKFIESTMKLRSLTYGSKEYEECRTHELSDAINHHYQGNDHHPEHFDCTEKFTSCCGRVLKDRMLLYAELYNKCPFCNLECVDNTQLIRERYTLRDMNLIQIIEMIADWTAASSRHPDGDVIESININQKRFGYSDELKEILINTIRYFQSSIQELKEKQVSQE